MHNGKRLGRPYRRDTALMTKVDGVWVRKLSEKELKEFKRSIESDQPRYGQKIELSEAK